MAVIVIDDGRRFLARTRAKYDVIVTDPPPPVEAAGSSLLYSNEFYEVAKQHLNPGGILQAWIPEVEERDGPSDHAERHRLCSRTCVASPSVVRWGTHLLVFDGADRSAHRGAARGSMPEAAKRDLIEWSPSLKRVRVPRNGLGRGEADRPARHLAHRYHG